MLWDSSAFLALLDSDDADHARAVVVARRIAAERRPSFLTSYVEVEAHALLLRKLGRALAREWLLAHGMPTVRVAPAEEERARQLVATHADKEWSFCDALSFAVIELRHVSAAFSFDHHFRQFGRCEILGG